MDLSTMHETPRPKQESHRYYYRPSLATFILIPVVSLILIYTVYDMATGENRFWIRLIHIITLFVWGTTLLHLIWLLILDRYNLSYVEMLENGIKKRNGYLRETTVTFNHTFIYKESKGDIKAIKVYDNSKKCRMIIGNSFERSPSEIKTLIQQRKTDLNSDASVSEKSA
ncbi:MAG: hypothetical protein ACOCU0_00455 [Bacillota bacterium]